MPYRTYTELRDLFGTVTSNNSGENKALGDIFINAKLGDIYGQKDWPFMYATDLNSSTVASQQAFDLPADVGKLQSVSVEFSSTVYSPRRSPTRQHWELLNQTTSVTSDTPEWYYRVGSQILFYPRFSSANGQIKYYYKKLGRQLGVTDITGTVESATNGSKTVVTGISDLTSAMAGLFIRLDRGTTATEGDGRWYEIGVVQAGSQVALTQNYMGDSFSAALALNYTIGQVSLLPEQYQELPVWGATEIYFTSIEPEPQQAQLWKTMYAQGILQLQREYGSLNSDPSIESGNMEMQNPNFFIQT